MNPGKGKREKEDVKSIYKKIRCKMSESLNMRDVKMKGNVKPWDVQRSSES